MILFNFLTSKKVGHFTVQGLKEEGVLLSFTILI